MIYKRLEIADRALSSNAFKLASVASLRGASVILLYTPQAGWHGFEVYSDDEAESWDRMVRLTLADGTYAYFPLCQIQAALEITAEGLHDAT
jgi:hypothetical protein